MSEMDTNSPEYEKALNELLDLISGRGFFGPGITTYTVDDPDHRKLHDGCLELERRGKIVRHLEEGDAVVWKPREDGKRIGVIKGAEIGVYEVDTDPTPRADKNLSDYQAQLKAKKKRNRRL